MLVLRLYAVSELIVLLRLFIHEVVLLKMIGAMGNNYSPNGHISYFLPKTLHFLIQTIIFPFSHLFNWATPTTIKPS